MVSAAAGGFPAVLIVQLLMICGDLTVNAVAPLFYYNNTVQLMIYVVQDTSTIMAVIIMLLSSFSTFIFKAGLMNILYRRFQTTIYVSALYLALSIFYHTTSLSAKWEHELEYRWTYFTVTLLILQRCCALIYYYYYKRTALMLRDSHYYQDSPWLRQQLESRRA